MPFRRGLTGAATLAFCREEEILRFIPPQDLDLFYDQTVKPLKARLDSDYMEKATLGSDVILITNNVAACFGFNAKRPFRVFCLPHDSLYFRGGLVSCV